MPPDTDQDLAPQSDLLAGQALQDTHDRKVQKLHARRFDMLGFANALVRGAVATTLPTTLAVSQTPAVKAPQAPQASEPMWPWQPWDEEDEDEMEGDKKPAPKPAPKEQACSRPRPEPRHHRTCICT